MKIGTLHGWTMFPLQRYGLLNENLRVNRIPSYEFLVKGPRVPQTTHDIAIALGCLPVLDGMTIWLKSQHPLATGQREIKLELTGKLPPACLLP